MSTVQANILKVLQIVDPSLKTGVVIDSTNLVTWVTNGSDRFPAQRILDCYNSARKQLANTISIKFDAEDKQNVVADNLNLVTNLTFTSGSAPKPTGYVETFSMHTVDGTLISVLPASLYGMTNHLDSAQNPIVYEYSTTFKVASSSTLADASTYVLRYFGLTDFTLTDVTGGTTVETFNGTMWDPLLVELSVAIASELGAAQINALIERLIGSQRTN